MQTLRRIIQTQARRNFSIAAKREKFYSNPAVGADNPTYLKEKGDRLVTTMAAAGGFLGFTGILLGLVDMSMGWNKKN